MESSRIILDTNLWISFLITKRLYKLDSLVKSGRVTILYSKELLEEFLEVAKRPKFSRFFQSSDIQDLLVFLLQIGELIFVKTAITQCRDEKDNFLLSLAHDGDADFLITGDADLLEIKILNKTRILTWTEFSRLFN